MKGKVKTVSVKNRSALISTGDSEKWYNFGDKVKMDFVKKGDCEFTVDEQDEDLIPFIKCIGEAKKEFKPATEYTPEKQGFNSEWDKVKQQRISRSGLINSAIALYELNNISSKEVREIITEQQIIDTARKFEEYISEE